MKSADKNAGWDGDEAGPALYTADDHRALRLGRAIVGMARTQGADDKTLDYYVDALAKDADSIAANPLPPVGVALTHYAAAIALGRPHDVARDASIAMAAQSIEAFAFASPDTVAADATVMAMVNDLIGLADGRLKSEGRQWDPAAEPNLSRRAAMLLAADYAAGADRPGYVTLFAHTSTIEGDDSLDLDICEGFGVTRETMAALAANPGDLGTLPADEMYVFVLCRVLWEVDGIGVEPYLEVVATMSSAEFAGEEAPR